MLHPPFNSFVRRNEMICTRQSKHNGNKTILVEDDKELRQVLRDIIPEGYRASDLNLGSDYKYNDVINDNVKLCLNQFRFTIDSLSLHNVWFVEVHNSYGNGKHKYMVRMRRDSERTSLSLIKSLLNTIVDYNDGVLEKLPKQTKRLLRTYLKAHMKLIIKHYYALRYYKDENIRTLEKQLHLWLCQLSEYKHFNSIARANSDFGGGWTDPITIIETIHRQFGNLVVMDNELKFVKEVQ